MIVAFLVVVVALISFSFFTVTTRINAINRVVITTPFEIFETSIPLLNEDNNIDLYFDKDALEEKLADYYFTNLEKYTSEITIDFYYYNQEDKSYCLDDKCNAVEVCVESEIVFDFQYSRTMYYEIKKGAYGRN